MEMCEDLLMGPDTLRILYYSEEELEMKRFSRFSSKFFEAELQDKIVQID